ncbi:MAG TPA: dihydroneopterin aldolase [Acidimicrobiales bacterium]
MTGDRIEVRGLRLLGVHGVLPEERSRAQPFEVDLDLEIDMAGAALSDDLADTADYGAAIQTVADVVGAAPHDLLESLAGAIADALLADGRIRSATVAVRKLRPPVPHEVVSTGVRMTRSRS